MVEYIKRVFFIIPMVIFVSIIMISGNVQAVEFSIQKKTSDWYFPVNGEVSDVFASRNGEHKGIDIAGKIKSPVFAASDGKVIKSYYSQSYGNVIFIHHSSGFETVYAHLHKRLVVEGQKVLKGEKIGLLGNTGNSTGTHLHFEIHNGKWTIDKKNAIDPFTVYGEGEIGQYVLALTHKPFEVVAASGTIQNDKEEEGVITSYFPIRNNRSYSTQIKIVKKEREIINKEDEKNIYYTVKKGDTLNKLSELYDVSVNDLQQWNKIKDKDLIIQNQKLLIKQQK